MPTLDSLSAFQPLSSPCRSSDLSTDGSSIITTAFPKGSFLFYFIGFSGWWREQGQGGREETSSNKWHTSVAAALIWSKEKDAVWFLSFPGQIMEPNSGSMFPSSQEKKYCVKARVGNGNLFYCPVVSLFLQMTPVLSCCALISPSSYRVQLL